MLHSSSKLLLKKLREVTFFTTPIYITLKCGGGGTPDTPEFMPGVCPFAMAS